MSYILNGSILKTPKSFRREYVSVSSDKEAIDGKSGRDIRLIKERFIIFWNQIFPSDLATILNIVNLDQAVTFQVNEENLTVNQTQVLVRIRAISYIVPGDDYLSSVEIELDEVE